MIATLQNNLYSTEPEMEAYPHLMQMLMLISCLQWYWRDRHNYFVAGNLTIYFSPSQKKSEFFRGPDFFVVKDCDPNPYRRSWMVWEEGGRYPDLIVEILSESTADSDRTQKKQIYQDIFRTPNYFLFDPITTELEGYRLIAGEYIRVLADGEGKMWSEVLELFLGVSDRQLRFFTPDGKLVSSPQEEAKAEKLRADANAEKIKELTQLLRQQDIDFS